MKFSSSQTVLYLFFLTGMILVVLGIGSLLRIVGNLDRAVLYTFYALLMFGDAAAMFFFAIQLKKRTKPIFALSIIILSLNIFPTIFDQFGLVDLLFLLLNMITLMCLVVTRKEFLPA